MKIYDMIIIGGGPAGKEFPISLFWNATANWAEF